MAEMKEMGLIEEVQDQARVGEPAPENEQKMYDYVVNAGMAMIYSKKMTDKILGMLQSAEDLPTAIGRIVNMIGDAIQQKAKGQQIPDDVLYHAAGELIDLILELAEKAGIQTNEDTAEMAFYKTMEIWADTNPDKAMADVDGLKRDFEELPPEAIKDVEMRFMRKKPVAEGVQQALGA
jgi:hypothetical protein